MRQPKEIRKHETYNQYSWREYPTVCRRCNRTRQRNSRPTQRWTHGPLSLADAFGDVDFSIVGRVSRIEALEQVSGRLYREIGIEALFLSCSTWIMMKVWPAYAQSPAQSLPNILHIIADDMGLHAWRCYDLGEQQTPMLNLEQLCAEVLVFDNAYSASICSPTRTTIMTGLYGFRTGVGTAVERDNSNGFLWMSLAYLIPSHR